MSAYPSTSLPPQPSGTSSKKKAVRGCIGLGLAVALAAGISIAGLPSAPAANAYTPIAASLKWRITLGNAGHPVALSSPMVGTLDNAGSSIIIGDRAGYERAFHLQNGSGVAGWPVQAGAAVDSTASIVGSTTGARIFFGEGNSGAPSLGGYKALSNTGKTLWSVKPQAQPGAAGTAGVMSSLAVGNIQHPNDVVGGSMGQTQDLIYSASGKVGLGFPWFQADSNFSTPAIANVGNGSGTAIIEGGDSTGGNAFGTQYSNGGHIRILHGLGNNGTGNPSGGLKCEYNTNQVVQSSPAVGPVLAGNSMGIVVGTGSYWSGASDTNKLIAIDANCNVHWKDDLHGITDSSPAIARVAGGTKDYIVQGARISNTLSNVYVIDGATGKALWHTTVPGGIFGGITTADLTGKGYQDVVVPTVGGTFILDGKDGHLVYELGQGYGFQNSALITNDPDGSIGITLAGYDNMNRGVVLHYTINNSTALGAHVNEVGAWPMFHHDQKLDGFANTALPVKP